MPQTIQSIYECFNQAAYGTLKNLEYVQGEGISSFPKHIGFTDDQTVQDTITLGGGYSWLTMGVLPKTLKFKNTQKTNLQGNNFPIRLEGEIPAFVPRHEISSMFERMARHRWVLKFKDFEGTDYLLGSPDAPLIFTADEEIDRKVHGGHVFPFEFNGVGLYRVINLS